eukprot:746073-Hanusia_phi.AAC.1
MGEAQVEGWSDGERCMGRRWEVKEEIAGSWMGGGRGGEGGGSRIVKEKVEKTEGRDRNKQASWSRRF